MLQTAGEPEMVKGWGCSACAGRKVFHVVESHKSDYGRDCYIERPDLRICSNCGLIFFHPIQKRGRE